MPGLRKFPIYGLAVALAMACGAGARAWYLSNLHHYYLQGGTTAWKVSLALSVAGGRGLVVDEGFVHELQDAQVERAAADREHGMIDPVEFLLTHPHNPDTRWDPSTDTPGYSLVAAAFWRFLPARYIYIQFLQVILDLLAILMMAKIGRRLMNPAVGAVSAWIYALWPIPVLFSVLPLRDYFAIFSVILSLFLVTLFIQTRRWAWAWLAGMSLGLLFWIRPVGFLLPLAYAACLWIYRGWSTGWRSFLALSLPVALLFFLPLAGLNKILMNRWSTSLVGLSLWESLGSSPNPYGFQANDEAAMAYAASVRGVPPDSLAPPVAYGILLDRVVEVARKDPGFVLGSLFRRVPEILTMGYAPFLFVAHETGMVKIAWPFTLLRYLHMASWLLALAGFLLLGRDFGYRRSAVLWAPTVAVFISFWPVSFPDPRFFMYCLLPFPFMVVAGAWAGWRWLGEGLARRRKRTS